MFVHLNRVVCVQSACVILIDIQLISTHFVLVRDAEITGREVVRTDAGQICCRTSEQAVKRKDRR